MDIIGTVYHDIQGRGILCPPFKFCLGVTQVDPLPHTIFNVVVDSVIYHWVVVVVVM